VWEVFHKFQIVCVGNVREVSYDMDQKCMGSIREYVREVYAKYQILCRGSVCDVSDRMCENCTRSLR